MKHAHIHDPAQRIDEIDALFEHFATAPVSVLSGSPRLADVNPADSVSPVAEAAARQLRGSVAATGKPVSDARTRLLGGLLVELQRALAEGT